MVEEPFLMRFEDVHFRGFIDCLSLDSATCPVVVDHKTTSALKWIKTEQELKDDVQAAVYAKYALTQRPEAESVALEWIYYVTKGQPQAKAVIVILEKAEIEEKFGKVMETALEMAQEFKNKTKAVDLEANTAHCEEFGGCFHRERCTSMGVFDKIQRETKNQQVNPPDAAQAEAPVEAQAEAPVEASEKRKRGRPKLAVPADLLRLYVDCIPVQTVGETTLLDSILAPVLEMVEREAGVSDYRLIEYGAGAGKVVEYLKMRHAKNPIKGHILVNSSLPEHRIALQTLTAYADIVIRGL